VPTNGAKALFKNAPEHLQEYMVDHIKQVSGATVRASRSETDKIDKLFDRMELSYALNTGKIVNFQRGQDLATGLMHYINQQHPMSHSNV